MTRMPWAGRRLILHPIWNIVSGVPGNVYSVTLKLQDINGVYPTAPFVLSFTPVQVRYSLSLKQLDAARHAFVADQCSGMELQSAASVTALDWTTITNVPGIAGTNFFPQH